MAGDSSILITGASSGIGAACAIGLAQRGYRVFAGVRRQEDGERLEREGGDLLQPVTIDVTEPDSIRGAVDAVHAALDGSPLNAVFNNAGILVAAPLELVPLDELRRQLEVNVVGTLAVIQAFLPDLRAAKGRIITTGSIGGFFATPLLGPYCMSKYALEALNDALRLELIPQGIEVILLEPGSVSTGIWDKRAKTLRDGTPELCDAQYGEYFAAMDRYAAKAKERASDPKVVLDAVIDAIESPTPKTRYLVGHGARVRSALRRLPDRWRDRLILRSMGVRRA